MRRWIISGLIMLNVLLAMAMFVEPARTAFMSRDMKNCCRGSVGESEKYCCFECCYFVNDCESDEDCGSITFR